MQASVNLERDAVGFPEILFQALGSIGPAAFVVFVLPLGAAYAGGAMPLAAAIGAALCLTVAISVGELARHLPSAGGIYTFVSRGLGPRAGFLVAWLSLAGSLTPVLILEIGIYLAGLMAPAGTPAYQLGWVGAGALTIGLTTVLGYFGVKTSTRVGAALGLFEVGVFVALALWLMVRAGTANSFRPFGLELANVPGREGASGLLAAVLYSVTAFAGFESGTPLAEETRDPQRTIRRATVWSCVTAGLFGTLTLYAATVAYGMDRFAEFASFEPGTPWMALAREAWGGGAVLLFLAIVTSIVACHNAWVNYFSRIFYSLARIRLLPASLGRVHSRWRSPHIGVFAYGFVSAAVALGLGAAIGPAAAFALITTITGMVYVMNYLLLNAACFAYYRRERRAEFNWLRHGVAPIGGVLVLIPVLLISFGVGGSVFSFVQPLTGVARWAGPTLAVWLALGLTCYLWLARRHPERLGETGRIFLEEPAGATGAARS